jgi:hypothetical protein
MTFTKCLSDYNNDSPHSNHDNHIVSINHVFAIHGDEEEFYPLTIRQIAGAQEKDKSMKNNITYDYRLVENIKVVGKNDKLVIPKTLQCRAIGWYHHYLQIPRNT